MTKQEVTSHKHISVAYCDKAHPTCVATNAVGDCGGLDYWRLWCTMLYGALLIIFAC